MRGRRGRARRGEGEAPRGGRGGCRGEGCRQAVRQSAPQVRKGATRRAYGERAAERERAPTDPSLQLATHSSLGTNPFLPTNGLSPAASSSYSAKLVLDEPAPPPRAGLPVRLRSATLLTESARSGRLPRTTSDAPSPSPSPPAVPAATLASGADEEAKEGELVAAEPSEMDDKARPDWRSRRAARRRRASATPCARVKLERSSRRLSVMVRA